MAAITGRIYRGLASRIVTMTRMHREIIGRKAPERCEGRERLLKFFRSSPDVDEIDVRGHQIGQGIHIVPVPGFVPCCELSDGGFVFGLNHSRLACEDSRPRPRW